MFDLQDESSTRVHRDGPWDRVPDGPEGAEEQRGNELDSEENQALHRRLLSLYQQELDRQYENRVQQAIDEDFYDHIQFTEEEIQELALRGQAATVYNVIAQTCNWVMGSEKRGRADFKVLPRRKDEGQSAERKTALLKYLSDVNKTPFHRSRAFEDVVKVGIGWLEDGIQDDDDGEMIYSRYESWRNMLWDSASTEMDLGDCRFVSRTKWVDVDVAKAIAPGREDIIELSKDDGLTYGYDGMYADEVMDQYEAEREDGTRMPGFGPHYRERVRLIEIWFRKPMKAQRIVSGMWRGSVYEDDNPHPVLQEFVQEQEQLGNNVLAERVMMRMHCAIMTSHGLLYLGPSPYRHNEFPFTPIWGYRRGRDGLPYGVVRGLRDIQSSINKRMSKALYIMSTNKIVMDEGAVEDVEVLRREAARPDAVIEKRIGKELRLDVDRGLDQAHLEWAGRDIAMIQQVGGVTDEMMGRTTNATSGVAVQARQEQGALTTSKLFDNLRFAFNEQGAKQLSMVEQFMTDERQFRITNERGTAEYITVNDGLPENDIVRQKADFVISEGEWRASLRQAQAGELLEVMTRMPPQVAMVMLDLVIENMDLANREEMVKRIRQITGQADPDADPDSPEEQARMQAQAAQQQMQQAMVEAQLRQAMAKAGKDEAAVAKVQGELQQIAARIAKENIDTTNTALDAAIKAIQAPVAVPVADGMLQESGFVSRTEQEQQAAAMAEQEAEQQAMMEQAAAEQQAAQGGLPPSDGAAPDGTMPQL